MCEQDQTAELQPGPQFYGEAKVCREQAWVQEHMNAEAQDNVGCIFGSDQFLSLCKVVWAPKTSFCKFPINISLGKYLLKRKLILVKHLPRGRHLFSQH